MLATAKLKDLYPKRLVLWGIQPELMEIGLELSPLVTSKMDVLVGSLVEQLKAWGHAVRP